MRVQKAQLVLHQASNVSYQQAEHPAPLTRYSSAKQSLARRHEPNQAHPMQGAQLILPHAHVGNHVSVRSPPGQSLV